MTISFMLNVILLSVIMRHAFLLGVVAPNWQLILPTLIRVPTRSGRLNFDQFQTSPFTSCRIKKADKVKIDKEATLPTQLCPTSSCRRSEAPRHQHFPIKILPELYAIKLFVAAYYLSCKVVPQALS
jgi:hypothetical protein